MLRVHRRRRHLDTAAIMAAIVLTTTPGGAQSLPRVEVGPTTALNAIFPAFGGLGSLRIGDGALEGAVDVIPWLIDEGDHVYLLFQVQARLPWRASPGHWRSVTLGLSSAATLERVLARAPDGTLTTHRRLTFSPALLPHAGVTWHWRTGRFVTMRLDLQAIVVLGAPAAWPRVAWTISLPGRSGP